MASYYYLITSLPTLFLDEESPITSAEFLAMCDRWLGAEDARDMHILMAGHPACAKASSFVPTVGEVGASADRPEMAKAACICQWQQRETEIRNTLVRLRAAKAHVDAAPFLRPCPGLDLYTERAVAEAMNRPQPLEREIGLDRLRWSLLDDLARFDPFGLPAVVAYAVKLRLVERWSSLTVEQGRAAVENYLTQQPMEVAV